jgi:hypothetical protein
MPSAPKPLKRKASSPEDEEEDEAEKARKRKLMTYNAPKTHRQPK